VSGNTFRAEFGRYTSWILEAAEAIGVEDHVAVACRGTGDPALFDDLARAIGARPGMRVLDLGCGMGGPGAWLRATRECDVVGVDLMLESVRATRRLFPGSLAVTGSTSALPFRTGAFEGLWTVGVLEMIDDKAVALREAARVLADGGRMAIYGFTTTTNGLEDPPSSNHFVAPGVLRALAVAAGFDVVAAGPARAARSVPPSWTRARAAVADEIRRRHGDDADFEEVRGELARFAALRAAGAVQAWRFDLTKQPAVRPGSG
jgi:SAM-dependent methyltransferase